MDGLRFFMQEVMISVAIRSSTIAVPGIAAGYSGRARGSLAIDAPRIFAGSVERMSVRPLSIAPIEKTKDLRGKGPVALDLDGDFV